MGKLSETQARQLKELERMRDSDEDDEDEVWVRRPDGHSTLLRGERARRWLKANGYDEGDAEESSSGEPLEAEKGAPKPAAEPKEKKGKHAAPDDDETETDPAPPVRNARAFF